MADTAAQVRALQRMGIRVSAVFMGEDSSAGAAAQIYGKTWPVSAAWTNWPARPGG